MERRSVLELDGIRNRHGPSHVRLPSPLLLPSVVEANSFDLVSELLSRFPLAAHPRNLLPTNVQIKDHCLAVSVEWSASVLLTLFEF